MKFIDYLPSMVEEKKPATGKIVLKTALITSAILAFVPTVFKINKGKGFDAYSILSHVKYEKNKTEEGKIEHNVSVTLVDLSRYGIEPVEEVEEVEAVELAEDAVEAEEDENSSCIEE